MRRKINVSIDIPSFLVVLVSTALLITALVLFYVRSRDSSMIVYVDDSNTVQEQQINNSTTTPQNNDSDIINDGIITQDINSKYKKFGECKDYDTNTPYFVKSFIGNYTYKDGGYVSDYCVEDIDSSSLTEFTCVDGEILPEAHTCPHGCLLGACIPEKEQRAYMLSSIASDSVRWEEDGVQYSIISGYVGNIFAPINTLDSNGELIKSGTQIYGLSFILDIENTNDATVCAPLSLKRIIDETGASVEPNINEFYFDFSGGCEIPKGVRTQYKVIFITEPGQNDFVISAGAKGEHTFIVTQNSTTGEIKIQTTNPFG